MCSVTNYVHSRTHVHTCHVFAERIRFTLCLTGTVHKQYTKQYTRTLHPTAFPKQPHLPSPTSPPRPSSSFLQMPTPSPPTNEPLLPLSLFLSLPFPLPHPLFPTQEKVATQTIMATELYLPLLTPPEKLYRYVVNLPSKTLPRTTINLLSKGPGYTPTPKTPDRSNLWEELNSFLRITHFFTNDSRPPTAKHPFKPRFCQEPVIPS